MKIIVKSETEKEIIEDFIRNIETYKHGGAIDFISDIDHIDIQFEEKLTYEEYWTTINQLFNSEIIIED